MTLVPLIVALMRGMADGPPLSRDVVRLNARPVKSASGTLSVMW
jgi:hypothetical protein